VTNYADSDKLNELPAGNFSAWLREMRHALRTDSGIDVDCGTCTACCTSSYFVHIRPDEVRSRVHIDKRFLFPAPGLPEGHFVLGYDKQGVCPMFAHGKCSIYEDRPATCRNFDCRVYSAVGIMAGGKDKTRVNELVQRWQFSYPAEIDREEHQAVKAAAEFISSHAPFFPEGRIPRNPSQLAIAAIKVYKVFLNSGEHGDIRSDYEIANTIVVASRQFDAGIHLP
jgi:uncharacterized protein